MSTTRYTEQHEWLRLDDDGTVTVGITDHAQNQLGEVVFVDLPEIGARFDKGAAAAVVESVKAASDVYAPIAGEVIAVNDTLPENPETVNSAPEGEGWFYRLKLDDPEAFEELMPRDAYEAYLER